MRQAGQQGQYTAQALRRIQGADGLGMWSATGASLGGMGSLVPPQSCTFTWVHARMQHC
jgi:hypothetical protein